MPKKLLRALPLLFALSALCFAFFAPLPAHAAQEDEYARVTRTGVYLYSEPNEDAGLFELPRTWFVRVTAHLGEYCSVAYLTSTEGRTPVYGYCRTDELTFVGYVPETPFLTYTVDVTFTAGDQLLPGSFITRYTVPAAYYGSFTYGSSVYYYVELDGKVGYVPASACFALDLPENTEYTEAETPSAQSPAEPAGGTAAVGIVLAAVLAAAALGAAVFLFRPARARKKHPADGTSDEREDVYF